MMSNAPEIRFRGFTDAWEQRKFLSLVDRVSKTNTDEILPRVEFEDIISGIGQLNKDLTEKPFFKNGIEFDSGDVLFGKLRPYLKNWLLPDFKGVAVGDFWVLRPNDNDSDYIYYLIQSDNFQSVANLSTGTKMPRSDWSVVSETVFRTPCTREQSRIGTFFHTLDNTIAIHKRKLNSLQELKKAYLQVMLPQPGETVPKLRFEGFVSAWNETALGEMLIERNEQIEESSEYPLMSFVGNLGVVPKGEQYDRSFLVKDDNKKYKATMLNDFIYSSNNLETGSIGLNKTGNAVISPVYSIFYSRNDSESQFVGLLSARKDFINKMVYYRQGIMYGQWRIHERDFLKIKILSPTTSEQNKIVQFFDKFDSAAALCVQKMEQLTQLKSAYLQKMFV